MTEGKCVLTNRFAPEKWQTRAMARNRRKTAGRPSAITVSFSVVAILGAVSCAEPSGSADSLPSSENSRERVFECSGGLTTVLSPRSVPEANLGPLFTIFGIAALPDGQAISIFDPNYPGAGADEMQGDPTLAVIDKNGALERLEFPEIEGIPVSTSTVVLLSTGDGTTYFFDPVSRRIVTRTGDGLWQQVIDTAQLSVLDFPKASVAADGTLYVATAGAVYRVRDGLTDLIAGDPTYSVSDYGAEAEPGLLLNIASGKIDRLPLITGFVVGPDDTLFLASLKSVYSISSGGLTSVILDATKESVIGLGRYLLPPITTPPATPDLPPPTTVIKDLAVDPQGRLVVSDGGALRVLYLHSGAIEVTPNISGFVNGTNVHAGQGDRVLLVYQGFGEAACEFEWAG